MIWTKIMGLISSRQQQTDESNEIVPAHVYKYPPKSGLYFGSHFMMGGERFEMGQTEAYLFGDNNDLNFLGAKPVQFPYPQSTSAEPTRPLYCSVAIRRDSLKFTRSNSSSNNSSKVMDELEDHPKYNLEFIFDCDTPCSITIYYFCTEETTPSGLRYISKHPELTSKSYQYEIGANQTFNQTEHFFSPFLYKADDLLYNQNTEIIPIVIHCVAESPDNGHGPQSHSTLAVVERSAEGSGYIMKPLKQKLYADGVCYLVQEIYGIENKNVPAASTSTDANRSSEDTGESGAECVICMSDLRDTLILPCRHLCLCSACAETLRYKATGCPICRSPFRALLQVKALRKIRATIASNLQSAGEQSTHHTDVPTFLNRYEQVPLIEALNGPVESSTAITLPRLPTIPTSQTAPGALRISPRAPPRRGVGSGGGGGGGGGGQSRKKTAKLALPIQEVLTPQAIPTKKYEDGDYMYCEVPPLVKRAASVDGFNNPSLPGQTENDGEYEDVPSVTCGVVVQKPELETPLHGSDAEDDDEDESDSSYRTPVAEKRTPRFETTVFLGSVSPPTFRIETGVGESTTPYENVNAAAAENIIVVHNNKNIRDDDESDANELPPIVFSSVDDRASSSRDETPLSSFSVGSTTSTKPLLRQCKSSNDEDIDDTTVECEKL